MRRKSCRKTSSTACRERLSEAGNSPTEFVRAIENHLKQFPNSPRRAELERALVKTAIDLNDDPRLIEFGERVLARDPDNIQVLEHVTTALLHQGDKPTPSGHWITRAISRIYSSDLRERKFQPGGGRKK